MFRNKYLYIGSSIVLLMLLYVFTADNDKDKNLVKDNLNTGINNINDNNVASILNKKPAELATKSTIKPQQNTSLTSKTTTASQNIAPTVELPPNFPKPITPFDEKELQRIDELIARGDKIIDTMDKLLESIELPPLTPAEKQELEQQRIQDMQQIQELERQLNLLRQ